MFLVFIRRPGLPSQGPFARTIQARCTESSPRGVCESVEWLFRDIVEYFKFIDFKKSLKIQLSSVGKYYIVCAIFGNALTCSYADHTSTFFDLGLQLYTFLNCCHHFNSSKTKGYVICSWKQGGLHNTLPVHLPITH